MALLEGVLGVIYLPGDLVDGIAALLQLLPCVVVKPVEPVFWVLAFTMPVPLQQHGLQLQLLLRGGLVPAPGGVLLPLLGGCNVGALWGAFSLGGGAFGVALGGALDRCGALGLGLGHALSLGAAVEKLGLPVVKGAQLGREREVVGTCIVFCCVYSKNIEGRRCRLSGMTPR